MKLANVHPTGNEKLSDMIPQMLWNLLANFVMACGLTLIYAFASSSSLLMAGTLGAIECAVIIWIGFIVAGSSMEVIWMGRKPALWLFECGCSLVVMVAMGAIIANV